MHSNFSAQQLIPFGMQRKSKLIGVTLSMTNKKRLVRQTSHYNIHSCFRNNSPFILIYQSYEKSSWQYQLYLINYLSMRFNFNKHEIQFPGNQSR